MAQSSRRGIARAACAAGLTAAMTLGGLPLAAVPAWAGTLTINAVAGNEGMTYDAYQVFAGTVTDGEKGAKTISGITWNAGAEGAATSVFGSDYKGSTAQDAADYIAAKIGGTTSQTIVDSQSFAGRLAKALAKSGVSATRLTAGTANDKLADGYYLVVSHGDSLKGNRAATAPVFTLVGGKSATAITEKASVPKLDKKVCEDSTGTYGRTADANRGQKVDYRLTATLPKNLASYDTYHLRFIDYLSEGLTYGGDAKVSVKHANGQVEQLDAKSKATVSSPYTGDDAKDQTGFGAGQGVLVVDIANLRSFKTAGGKAIEPTDEIVVDYSASLNGKAVVGKAGNPNKAKLVYSNNPHSDGEGATELVDPTLYTYQLNVRKRDKDKENRGSADAGLAGARFTLQVKASDGAKDGGSVGMYVQKDGSLGSGEYEFVSDDEGNIKIPCIDAGTYELIETAAPAGYSRMEGAATIKISSNRGEGGTLSVDADGTGNGAAALETAADKSSGQIDVTVRDTKNVGMPQTGSAGFAAMIAGGGSLVAVSLAALLRRKR